MRRFLRRCLLFATPIALVCITPTFILWKGGELTRSEELLKKHSQADSIVGMAYWEPRRHLKFRAAQQRRPRLLALGTSRVMQFRGFFFRDPASFYNAGGPIQHIQDFRAFLNGLEEKPDVLLIAFDPEYFNARWAPLRFVKEPAPFGHSVPKLSDLIFANSESIYKDLMTDKVTFGSVFAHENHIGLTAKSYAEGYRSDGSYRYGRLLNDPPLPHDPGFADTFKRISEGNRRFEYGHVANTQALIELDALLKYCISEGSHVVAFIPPMAHVVREALAARGLDYKYLLELHDTLTPIFERNGQRIFDFADLQTLGAGDDETIDGHHGSEKAYLRLTTRLCEEDARLRPYCRPHAELTEMLEESASSIEIFATSP